MEVEHDMNRTVMFLKEREEFASMLFAKLAMFESAKEASTMLELSMWKAKIDEYNNAHRDKRARAGHGVDHRVECRFNCGADIVVRNVLPYLLPRCPCFASNCIMTTTKAAVENLHRRA